MQTILTPDIRTIKLSVSDSEEDLLEIKLDRLGEAKQLAADQTKGNRGSYFSLGTLNSACPLNFQVICQTKMDTNC